MDERLVQYIKKELNLGFELRRIREALIKAGHEVHVVDEHIAHVIRHEEKNLTHFIKKEEHEIEKIERRLGYTYFILGLFLILIVLISVGVYFLYPDEHIKLGEESYIEGNYEKAVEEYNLAIENNPNSSDAYRELGWNKFKLAKLQNDSPELIEEAKIYLDKAIIIDPEDYDAQRMLADVYSDIGDYEIALEFLNRVILAEPENPEAYNSRGFLYYNMGEYDEAIADFNKAISFGDDFDEPYYALGQSYLEKEEYEAALENFYKAVAIDGEKSINYYGLARYYYMTGDLERARENIDRSLSLDNIFNRDEVMSLKEKIEEES